MRFELVLAFLVFHFTILILGCQGFPQYDGGDTGNNNGPDSVDEGLLQIIFQGKD